MSNQELIGTVYSEAFMNDTYRNVGIIKASGIKDELKCGTKLGKCCKGKFSGIDNIKKIKFITNTY